MGRSLKYDIPGEDPRVSVSDVAAKGWAALFARSGEGSEPPVRQRVVEIGFGRGEFLLAMAEAAPDVEFVGIEISFKRTLKMARKVARAKLQNVRLIEGRAQVALRALFDPGTLHEIWVNFSDPWPKARHAHRRVLQPAFVADAASRLMPGGMLYVATDDVPYAHQIDEVLAGEPSLTNRYAPWPFLPEVEDRLRTGYEEQWRAAGRPLHFFAYARVGGGSSTDGE